MRHVRIVAFPPFESEWSVMPYFCETEHKTGDIVKITLEERGELKYIFTDESHDVVYPAEGPILEETDSFPAGKYHKVFCLDEISLLRSNIPLKLDGFVEIYIDGAYMYESKKWRLMLW